MSNERDELAGVIAEADGSGHFLRNGRLHAYGPVADAILAAGYSKPQQITTPEELKALEDPEVVIVDFKQNAYQWGIGIDGSEGWQSTRDPNPITSDHLLRFAPLTVLHVGGTR